MLLRYITKANVRTYCPPFSLRKRLGIIGLCIKAKDTQVAKTFTTADEFLKYYGYKHVNDHYLHTIYAGYDYGDTDHYYHMYPLNDAIDYRNPDLELIELLLKDGANPNINTNMSIGPILHSIMLNSNQWNDKTIPLIKLLIKYGANVNLKRKHDKSTPLHRVAYEWSYSRAEEIIKLLIDEGAKINIWDSRLKTPYDNVLESHKWAYYEKKKLPEKILTMLNPKLQDKCKCNRE